MRSIWINPDDGSTIQVDGKTHDDVFFEHIDQFGDAVPEDIKEIIKRREEKPEHSEKAYEILDGLKESWPRITIFGSEVGLDMPDKSNLLLHFAQQTLMKSGLRYGSMTINFGVGGFIEDVSYDDFIRADRWSDILKPYRSFITAFALSKRAQEPIIPTPHIVIEPYEPAIAKALTRIPNHLKMNVTKVVVHSGGGSGHMGHVEMGPGKDPREIHIFKDRIREKVRQMFGTIQPTAQQLEQATERALIETIIHETGHIGPTRTQEQILQGPFFGEPEAEALVRQQLPTIASFEDALVKASLDLEEIREKLLPNAPIGEPNLHFVAQSMNQKKYYLVKSGVRLLTGGDIKPAAIEIKEAEQFNNIASRNIKVSKIIGVIAAEVGVHPYNDLNFVVALAKWQDCNGLEPTGKLDAGTLSKLGKNHSHLETPKNFGVVVPQHLYRGAIIENMKQLEALRDRFGVQRVVSLHNHPDITRMCHIAGLEHVVAPLETGSPSDFGRKILGKSISSFLKEKPTYIHCFYGQDRTGGVVARFRTETGWPCEAAYAEAKAYGFKDMFADLIDWFSEPCGKPPVDTDKIRKLLKNKSPYKNPETSQPLEQSLLEPHLNPVPNDMPFGNPYQDASEHVYVTWADTINSVAPTGILSIPVPSGSTGI